MDYMIFNDMPSGAPAQQEGESAQNCMEQTLRASCGGSRRSRLDEPGVCDLLAPEFYACDAERRTLTLAITVKPWMLNPKATLHGGMMATMLDTTMGLLVRYYSKALEISTVSLSVNYLRPALLHERLLVTARMDKQGHRMVFTNGDIARMDGKKIATATASFMI